MKNYMIAPSLLSTNFANIGGDIARLDKHFDVMHLDVMDGDFVKPITFGSQMVSALRPLSTAFFDVHLMTYRLEEHINAFTDAGANGITFHLEASPHAHRLVELIKSKDLKAGISIVPSTPVSLLEPILGIVDLVLVMSVNPGYGGQKFIHYSYEKIEELAMLKAKFKYEYIIQVDGGVNLHNAHKLFSLGANSLVVGSALVNENLGNNITQFQKICDEF